MTMGCGFTVIVYNDYQDLLSSDFHAEAKLEFDGSCSVQVYSVQASIPNDPAALWNAEYVQAEELFKQRSLDNCLRDNRYDEIFCLWCLFVLYRNL